jgi:hypothetical protein
MKKELEIVDNKIIKRQRVLTHLGMTEHSVSQDFYNYPLKREIWDTHGCDEGTSFNTFKLDFTNFKIK